jgi:protein-L-isoaspartate(D-aspartate) O-methyltransferase
MDEQAGGDRDGYASVRRRMVDTQLAARGVRDPATLAAMRLVPRERFVPEPLRDRAYDDGALAIGRGQTISQPYMVARMVEALRLADRGWPWQEGDAPTVLDVGLGSGYQAAVLAQLGARVTGVERERSLAREAEDRLRSLGYRVRVLVGDGSAGLPSEAPFAGIVVAAAAPSVPQPLVEQLADGARLVIPIGPPDGQLLTVIHRTGETTERETLDACVFVPLVGRYGYPG